ncbi:MAG: VOC family protein [Stagnimonas sp.]|nr:VOC family protein [Stagnimonas sp.]
MNAKAWGPIKQLAYVVEDLDAAIARWIAGTGVGPWLVYRNARMQGVCRGESTEVKLHVGLSYQGEVQIELIQPISATPSPYQHADGQPRVGMHHIAWHSSDLDRDVSEAQARGWRPVFEASNGAVRVAYFESPAEPGPLYEFIEAVPLILDGFAQGQQASRDWDGVSAPVTVFDFEART